MDYEAFNKTWYSFWAGILGQLVVTFVGVLLALAAEKWNENRQANNERLNTINFLKRDLKNVLAQIKPNFISVVCPKIQISILGEGIEKQAVYFQQETVNSLNAVRSEIKMLNGQVIFTIADTNGLAEKVKSALMRLELEKKK